MRNKQKTYTIKMLERGAGKQAYLYRKHGGKIIYDVFEKKYCFVDRDNRKIKHPDYSESFLELCMHDMFAAIGGVYPYYKVERTTYYAVFYFFTASSEIFKAKCDYNTLFEYRKDVNAFLHYYVW